MNRLLITSVLTMSFALGACGDDATDDAKDDADQKLMKDLTLEETNALCNKLLPQLQLSKPDACDLRGLYGASDTSTCEATRDACVSSPDEPSGGISCEETEIGEEQKTCAATVDDVSACLVAQYAALRTVTCASTVEDITKPIPECDKIIPKCPGFINDD